MLVNISAGAIILFSVALVLLILVHKSAGGGVSDMFGGGFVSTAASSSVSSKNLNRATYTVIGLWVLSIILFMAVV